MAGGEEAADALMAALQPYVRSVTGEPGMDILVRAFANLSGLGTTLVTKGKLKNAGQLRAFATGFSRRQAFFDFVDVGPGKERADFKVQGKNIDLILPSPTYLLQHHRFPFDPNALIVVVSSQKLSSSSWKVPSVNISCSLVGTIPVMHHFWGSL
jgi:hypothetical protein